MKTGKAINPAGTIHRQQLFHCLVVLSFLLSAAVLRAEERLMAVWSNHLAELNQCVPAGFVVVVQPPFVVIGDEVPGMVWSRATNTVKWAVKATSLKRKATPRPGPLPDRGGEGEAFACFA